MRPPVAAGPMSRNRRASKGPRAGRPDWASIRAGANENATAMPMNPMAARRRYAMRMMAEPMRPPRRPQEVRAKGSRAKGSDLDFLHGCRESRSDPINVNAGNQDLTPRGGPPLDARTQRIHCRDDGCPDQVDHRQAESPPGGPRERKLVE